MRRNAYVRGDSGVGHNYTHVRTRTCTRGRHQAGENIHNDGENYKKKRRAGLDLNVSGTRKIAAPTRITVLSHRRWQRDGRSIDGSEANEVKIWRMSPDGEPVGSGKGGKKIMHGLRQFHGKNIFPTKFHRRNVTIQISLGILHCPFRSNFKRIVK